MIERAYIHVTGPEGSGKTTLGRRIVETTEGPVLVARGTRDDTLNESKESSPARDRELWEYREAGASGVARYRFPSDHEGDDFFSSALMSDYSLAVVIEGDCPIDFVDLEVFVAPPLPEGEALLRRVKRAGPEQIDKRLEELVRAIGDRPAIAALGKSKVHEAAGRAARIYSESFAPRGAAPTWGIAPTHQGIERAGLVVVNVRADSERPAAESMAGEVARIRSDDEVRAAVLGQFGHKIPVTVLVANLADPKDAGTKKAIARIKRAIAKRTTNR